MRCQGPEHCHDQDGNFLNQVVSKPPLPDGVNLRFPPTLAPAIREAAFAVTFLVAALLLLAARCPCAFSSGQFGWHRQIQRLAGIDLELLPDVRIVPQKLPGVFSTLADALAGKGKPGATLFQ